MRKNACLKTDLTRKDIGKFWADTGFKIEYPIPDPFNNPLRFLQLIAVKCFFFSGVHKDKISKQA